MNPGVGPRASTTRPFLGVHFRCAAAYVRAYRSADGTRYEARCPRCLTPIEFRIAPGGTDAKSFVADCR